MSEREQLDTRVLGALIDSLYRQATSSILGLLATLAMMGFVHYDRQPPAVLLPWLAAQGLLVCVGIAFGVAYHRQNVAEPADPHKWATIYTVMLGALGVCWGTGCALFFDADDPIEVALLLILSSGASAGMLVTVSCHPPAFWAFTVLGGVPLIVRCLATGRPAYMLVGVAISGYLVFCLAASRRLHALFRKASELRFNNEALATKLSEEKLRAERALTARSKLLAAASHDLRQPLHALGMFVELLDEHSSTAQQRSLLGRIRASTSALTELLNALLDISRVDSDTLRSRREHFQLAPLLDQLAAEHTETARQKGLAFRVAGGELIVDSDPELLARLVRNLLSNALRFTEQGEISLTARALDETRVELSVADTGPGIPETERHKVFEEFYQIGNSERSRERGLGLGLAIVRGLAKVLDHPIAIRSQPERAVGTELVVVLPAGDPELALASEAAASSGPPAHSLIGRSVLIIDDERDIRDAMSALLGAWQCEPICARDLDEALAVCAGRSDLPDLVLCDYRLPHGVTGATVLAELEARWGKPLVCVIITGDTSPERIREARSSGRPVLFKPVVPGKLRALLSALLHPPS